MARSRYRIQKPDAPHNLILIGTLVNWTPLLDYTHYNPVKRGHVDAPEDWRYSSARNYAGREGLVDVFTDWG